MATCKTCGRHFNYDGGEGYDREFCGFLCSVKSERAEYAAEARRLREQLAASEASRERLLKAATIGLAWMDHSLEFFDWTKFPALKEELETKREQVHAAIAAERAAKA